MSGKKTVVVLPREPINDFNLLVGILGFDRDLKNWGLMLWNLNMPRHKGSTLWVGVECCWQMNAMYLKNILVMPMMMHMDILIYTQGFHKNATPLCCINERIKFIE